MLMAFGFASVIEVDPLIAFGGISTLLAVSALFGSPVGSVLNSSVDISALTAYAGKNYKQLITTMVNGLDFLNDVMLVPNVKNKLRLGKLSVSEGARPFSSTEEFLENDLIYTDRFLEVSPFKRELKIDPEEFRPTYLSEVLTPGTGANKKEIPFAQFTWMKVFEKLWAEINDNTAWLGFDKSDAVAFSGAATYTAGDYIIFTPSGSTVSQYYIALAGTSAGESPNSAAAKWQKVTNRALFKGFGTLISEEITATNLTEVAIGAITGTAGVARGAFKALFRSMPQAYQNSGVVINCSLTDFNFLMDDIEDISKYTRPDVSQGSGFAPNYLVLPGTNGRCIVKAASWITGRRLVAGPMMRVGGQVKNGALVFGTDLTRDWNEISIKDTDLWTLKAGIKALGGTQIDNLEVIRVNDQA